MSKTITFIREHANQAKDGAYYLDFGVAETLELWSAACKDEQALEIAVSLLKSIRSKTEDIDQISEDLLPYRKRRYGPSTDGGENDN